MSRTINSSLQAKLTAGTTNLCHIVTITRKDGEVFRYTDLDFDVVVGGDTYESSDSFAVTAITSSANNGIQSTTCNILFSADGFTELDIVKGKYDHASVEFAIVDYTNTAWGKLILLTGLMSSIQGTNRKNGQFEMNGLLSIGDAKIGEYYSAECRANLGDARCKVDLDILNQTGEVDNFDGVSATFRKSFMRITFNGDDPENNVFDNGVIEFTGGANDGIVVEIAAQFHADELFYGPFVHDIFLLVPLPNNPEVGDTFIITAGCDKRPITCKVKYNNIVNFRGEPFVPGSDYINDLKLV